MNKKILVSIIIALLLIGIAVFFVLRKTPSLQQPPSPPGSSNVLPGAPTPPPSSLPLAQTVDEARKNAFTNTLKDAQGNPWEIDKNNTQGYMLANKTDYSIIYFAKYDSFLISILATPFEEKRKEAELRFLGAVNAPAAVACQLTVTESTPHFVDPLHAGKNFRLSFCK